MKQNANLTRSKGQKYDKIVLELRNCAQSFCETKQFLICHDSSHMNIQNLIFRLYITWLVHYAFKIEFVKEYSLIFVFKLHFYLRNCIITSVKESNFKTEWTLKR